ncbi:hypothetical protein MMC12_007347 [Toensbergia leucococca]|nr:hypothetical protein [Toensbergia leucococca]
MPPPTASNISDFSEAETVFGTKGRRELELRLLHHFITIVTYTFPACNEQRYRDLWTFDAVHSGFRYPFLLHAILAISALHLLSDVRSMSYFYARDENQVAVERVARILPDTNNRTDLAKAHQWYLNMAVREQREAISNLSSSNADAVFMASLLISYQSLRLIPDLSTSTSYRPPMQWLKMCKAIGTIIEAAQSMVQSDSVIARFLAYTTEPDVKDEMAMFNPLYRKPFDALLDWTKYPEPCLNLETRTAYEKTLAYVGGVYHALLEKEAPRIMIRRIVCLGVLAPPRYIELLEQGRPRALAILAHHLALSRAIEDHWWFHGVADRAVNGIRSILPAEWLWAMEWPLSMIEEKDAMGP